MKKKFILIGHKKKHGKDTFARMLKEHLGNAEILSFADPMREILAEQKGVSVDEFKEIYNNDELERDKVKTFGNGKMIDYFGEQVWRDVVLNRAEKLQCKYIIVPDFRFKRELIDDSITIKITNPRIAQEDDHQSETELDEFDFDIRILNNGSISELYRKAFEVSNEIKASTCVRSRKEEMELIFSTKSITTEEEALSYIEAMKIVIKPFSEYDFDLKLNEDEVSKYNEYIILKELRELKLEVMELKGEKNVK